MEVLSEPVRAVRAEGQDVLEKELAVGDAGTGAALGDTHLLASTKISDAR